MRVLLALPKSCRGGMGYGICLVGLSASILSFNMSIAQAASFQGCLNDFYAKTAPVFVNNQLEKNTQPMCFNGFAVMYSGVSKTPLWSAEYLTRTRIEQAEQLSRNDNFHEEGGLPKSMRARLQDYSKSGYDRGHLSPNGDMATENQQYDSFSLANIAPQSPRNNRYVWRNIESATRQLAKKYGEVYVVTGVTFTQKKITRLNNRVFVPSHFFKAVYIPAIAQAGVYYAPNDESDRVEVISIDDLALRSGIDVMPAISASAKSQAFDLPTTAQQVDMTNGHSSSKDDHSSWLAALLSAIMQILVALFKA